MAQNTKGYCSVYSGDGFGISPFDEPALCIGISGIPISKKTD
jgi:hypothetical protein